MLVRLTYKSLQNRNYFKSKILYRVDLNKTGKKINSITLSFVKKKLYSVIFFLFPHIFMSHWPGRFARINYSKFI